MSKPYRQVRISFWDIIKEPTHRNIHQMKKPPVLFGYEGITSKVFKNPIDWDRKQRTLYYKDCEVILLAPSDHFTLIEGFKSDEPKTGENKFFDWLDNWKKNKESQ